MGKAPAEETLGSMSTQQDAQRPEGEAGVRRGRNAMEGADGEQDTPPPKPTTHVTSGRVDQWTIRDHQGAPTK
eukprot:6710056-Prymnesium_polylepis.1